jgi:arylsulfatase A-like enzyme
LNRPNILFAIADDASHMSAYGHRFVHTPNFDRVAQAGMLFMNAFTTNPKCAPSRASLLTGMHTWQLEEASVHQGIFPAKFKVVPDLLEEAGYFVGYTGKGWGPGDWKAGGFTRNPAGPEFSSNRLSPPENTNISAKDYAANFADFLAQRPHGQPFYFWYGGHEPHRPYYFGEGARAGKKIEDVDVPPYLPNDDIVKNDLLDYAYEIEWFDRHLGLMLDQLEEIGELDNTIVVVTSDNGMPFPRVKGQMYEQDFKLPLAICWKNAAKGGRKIDDLVSFIDLAPTFLEAAGVDKHPQYAGSSLQSIFQSDRAGRVDDSRNRAFMAKERHDVGREGDVGYPVRCIRTEQYLYVRNFAPDRWPAGNPETGYSNVDPSPTKELILTQHEQGEEKYYNLSFGKRPAEELYHIVDDSACMNNLAELPEYADLKQSLWNELKEKLEQTGDPRIFGDGDRFDQYAYTGGGMKTNSWEAYLKGNYVDKNKAHREKYWK